MNIGIDGFLYSVVGMYVEEKGTGHNIVVVVLGYNLFGLVDSWIHVVLGYLN